MIAPNKTPAVIPCSTCGKPVREGLLHTCPPRFLCRILERKKAHGFFHCYNARDAAIAIVQQFEGQRAKWLVATGREAVTVEVTAPDGTITRWDITGLPSYQAKEKKAVLNG